MSQVMLPLILNASLSNYEIFLRRKKSKKFIEVAQYIQKRDKHTCRFCGFSANLYFEIVNANQNFRDNRADNLVTACPYCTQCFFLDNLTVNSHWGGTLIFLEDISQAQLNAFSHVLFLAMHNNKQKYHDSAQAIYQLLKLRAQSVEKFFGEKMSLPGNFAQVFLEYMSKQQGKATTGKYISDFFPYLRLLPARTAFLLQINKWTRQVKL